MTPIYIPDTDKDKEPWTGTIKAPEIGRESWDFDLIRLRSGGDLYDTTPFTNSAAVFALLDHQRVCTLIRPLVTYIDPGSIGSGFPTERSVIKGQCQALLTDMDVPDLSKAEFTELSFDSEAFGAWYGGRAFSSDFDVSAKTFSVDIKKTTETIVDVDGLGKLTITAGAQLSPAGQSAIIRSVAITRLVFSSPRALEDVQFLAYSLERLFGFLIGFRGPYPAFNILREMPGAANTSATQQRGKLEIAPGRGRKARRRSRCSACTCGVPETAISR